MSENGDSATRVMGRRRITQHKWRADYRSLILVCRLPIFMAVISRTVKRGGDAAWGLSEISTQQQAVIMDVGCGGGRSFRKSATR